MKNVKMFLTLILLCVSSVFIVSCGGHKVSEKLSPSDVKSLIKNDTLYEKLIPRVQKIQDSVSKNMLLSGKFSDITYEKCLKYEKERLDLRDKFIQKYKPKVDEKLSGLKNKIESFRKIMDVSFYSTSIFFYQYIGGVEDGYFKFKITVTEPIEGGSFKYTITDKTTGKEIESSRCRFSQTIKDNYIGVWDIPYGIRDEFAYQTVNEIKNRYNFNFTILSVYKNGSLQKDSLSDDVSLNSILYKTLLLNKYKINLYDKSDTFDFLSEKDLYSMIILSEYDKEWEKECKNIDPLIFEYFNL